MGKRTVTSIDVAKRAGVSRTTVSMILNKVAYASFPEETRARVFEAAAALGYSPNSAARMLVSGTTDTIGFVISTPELLTVDAFVPQLLQGIGQAAGAYGYRVLLETVGDRQNPFAYHELVGGKRIDGLIVLNPLTGDEALVRLIEEEFPVVLLGSLAHPMEHAVNFRNTQPVGQLIRHLVALGHRKIGHISLPAGYVATRGRVAAFRRAMHEAGLGVEEEWIVPASFSAEGGYRAMEALLALGSGPSAVFAANDTLALGAIAAVHARGQSVPDDRAIVGFDDLPFAAFTSPPLTTVRNPAHLQGRLAAEKLIRRMRDETVDERRTFVETQVVIRQSCGAGRQPAVRAGYAAG